MAIQVGNFTATRTGTTINYIVSWVGFNECSNNATRTISFRLLDVNRNAIALVNNVTPVNQDGTSTGSFTNVYKGLFTVLALFICSDIGSIIVIGESPTVDLTDTSTVDPPTGGSEPEPVTNDPNATNSEGLCIPSTGAASMGDLNVIFGRVRNFASTELSGGSNPSVPPSLFGISFLPSTGTISKSRPNAISEFRGYCHVEPIQPLSISYECDSPGSEPGRIIINYLDINNTGEQVNRTVSGGGFVIGIFSVKPGTKVTVIVENDAVSPTGAEISVTRDAVLLVNQTGNPSAVTSFVPNLVSTYLITGTIGTSGGGGGGPI